MYVYIPRTQMTSIFEGQPPKTKPFPIKTRVVLSSRYIYIYTYPDDPCRACREYLPTFHPECGNFSPNVGDVALNDKLLNARIVKYF